MNLEATADVAGKRVTGEVVKLNDLTIWMRVPKKWAEQTILGLRPSTIIKRHKVKHNVVLKDKGEGE